MLNDIAELGRAYLMPDELDDIGDMGWEAAIALAVKNDTASGVSFWVKIVYAGLRPACFGWTEVNVCTVGYDNPTHTLTFPFPLREFWRMVNDADIEGCQEQDRREEVLDDTRP